MAFMSRYLLPVLAGAVALSAYAEDAGRRIEEIVVTAEKRQATVSDTSISITAFGQEMIAVIASPVPLFADIREGHESDGDYLAALNHRLTADSTGTEGRPVTADFLFITTKPRGQ